MNFRKIAVAAAVFFAFGQSVSAQQGVNYDFNSQINTIVTAVPFLRIVPDARFGGMGDCGIAMAPDPNSMHFNASHLAFAEKDFGVSATYTPWLRALGLTDVYLAYLSAYGKIDKVQSVGLGLRYFSLGSIQFTDFQGNALQTFRPNEFEINAAYSRKLGKNFSAGLGLKFIYSRLANNVNVGGYEVKPGTAFAADLSFTYKQPLKINDKKAMITAAMAISNLGTKISYTASANKDFIPTNLGLGFAFSYDIDDHNSITAGLDVNRLLVPTPIPRQIPDPNSPNPDQPVMIDNPAYDADANGIPDFKEQSVPAAMFSSFGDAPGGAVEELREFNVALGAEYWYDKQFAVRAGYFYEHPKKGGRRYLSVGLGLRYSIFGINFAYLVPTSNNRNPLDNTLRFSLTFDFDRPAKEAGN
jgi:hypothetical protein